LHRISNEIIQIVFTISFLHFQPHRSALDQALYGILADKLMNCVAVITNPLNE